MHPSREEFCKRQPLSWPSIIPASWYTYLWVTLLLECKADLATSTSQIEYTSSDGISLPNLGYEKAVCGFHLGSLLTHYPWTPLSGESNLSYVTSSLTRGHVARN